MTVSFVKPRAAMAVLLALMCIISWELPTSNDRQSIAEYGEPELVIIHPEFEHARVVIEAREEEITKELAALDRDNLKDDNWAKDWAGFYYSGDGKGRNVTIGVAPKAGLTYTWSGCLGLYDANYGEIMAAFPGGIKVKLALDPEKSEYDFMSSTLYFVRWGNQRYLVPERQMVEVVAAYNFGESMREKLWGALLLFPSGHDVVHDLERPDPGPPGRPQLPEPFAELIVDKPMRLRITGVTINDQQRGEEEANDRRKSLYYEPAGFSSVKVQGEVELDGGRDQGLKIGTGIYFGQVLIRLMRVDDITSRGAFAETLFHKSPPSLKPGMEIVLPGAKPDG